MYSLVYWVENYALNCSLCTKIFYLNLKICDNLKISNLCLHRYVILYIQACFRLLIFILYYCCLLFYIILFVLKISDVCHLNTLIYPKKRQADLFYYKSTLFIKMQNAIYFVSTVLKHETCRCK